MADEIVIRIEGDDDDDAQQEDIQSLVSSWMDLLQQSANNQQQNQGGNNNGGPPMPPGFPNNGGPPGTPTQNPWYPPVPPPPPVVAPPLLQDECECAPYFERIISILGSIWNAQIVPRNPGTPGGTREPDNNFAQLLANQIGNQLANAIAQINLAQFANDPIAATTSTIANIGNALGTTTNVLTTAAMTAILTPILGPLAPAVAGIIGAVAGEAISQFFGNIAEGIQAFFDYAARQSQELAPFSPEIISAQVGRSLSMLNFRADAGQNFGQQFADIYSAQTDLLLELEKLKLELFSRFQPYAEEAVKSLADVVAVIRIIIDEGDFSVLRGMLDAMLSMSSAITGPISAVIENLTADLAILAREARRARELDQQLQAGNVNREVIKFFGWQP
jgi:hypothetical protein